MNSIIMRGEAADVRHVYHCAAQLGAWTLEAGRLTARVRSSDPFRLSQSPLTFEVRRPNGVVWSWQLSNVLVTGAEFTATVREGEGNGA